MHGYGCHTEAFEIRTRGNVQNPENKMSSTLDTGKVVRVSGFAISDAGGFESASICALTGCIRVGLAAGREAVLFGLRNRGSCCGIKNDHIDPHSDRCETYKSQIPGKKC